MPTRRFLALPRPGEPIRVGIVSGYFREGHAIWRIPIKGWITQLDRKRFQVFGYHTGTADDEAAATARRALRPFRVRRKVHRAHGAPKFSPTPRTS